MTKIAVLDDWQDLAGRFGDWEALRARAEIQFFPDPLGNDDAAAAALAEFDVLLTVQDRTPLPGMLIDRLPNLRMVGITVSNTKLDLSACAARGIVVSKTDQADAAGEFAPAELALGLIIAGLRGIPQADAAVRAGRFQHGVPLGRALAERTLGIIGLGRLGSRLASYATALGMRVIAWGPKLEESKAASAGAVSVSKEELLARSDVVSIHVPLSPESRGLLGADDLAKMRIGALLVNTSRGPLVDEDALVDALRQDRIRAALDVYDDEPLPADHKLCSLHNVVLTPHLGYGVEEAWRKFYPQQIENVLAFLDGHPIRQARQ